jgi:putative flippase GtrA
MLVATAGMILNAAVLQIAIYFLDLHYLAAQVAATAIVFLVTYELNRRWTF